MMRDAIENFHTQFSYNPRIENAAFFKKRARFVVVGMGGSHLAADLLKAWLKDVPLTIHADYGLPRDISAESLVIVNSYSGNTEESLDGFEKARAAKLPLLAISCNGELLERAKKHSVPYIQMPNTGIQPRSALGFTFMAFLLALGENEALGEAARLTRIDPLNFENAGKKLAKDLQGKVPVLYSSAQNYAIAYVWKAKLNETGKIPAFVNIFPELNHNEMNGFDAKELTRSMVQHFCFVFFEDENDDPRVQKRMLLTRRLFEDRGLTVFPVPLAGESRLIRIFASIILADWAAFYTAGLYDVDPEQVPMVEELKRLMA